MTICFIESLANNKKEIGGLISDLSNVSMIGLDTETTGIDPLISKILLVQIGVGDNVYVMHRGNLGKLFFTKLLEIIKENNIKCIGHNIKFDIKILHTDTGILLRNLHDTMIVESVLTAGVGDKLSSLAKLVSKYCGEELVKDTRLEFIDMDWNSTFTDQQITYAGTDILYLDKIYNSQIELATKEGLLPTIELEMNLVPAVAKMELQGILLDVEHWNGLIKDSESNIVRLSKVMKDLIFNSVPVASYGNAYQFARALAIPVKAKKLQKILESIVDPSVSMIWINENFNIGSHKQLLTALHLCGIDTPDTNEKTLNKLPQNDIIDVILEYRDYEKRLSTYGQNIIDLINPVTGKIHTEYFQVGTQTGRFSSKNPNLQNIPIDNGFREGFISRPGYSFIAMDYSQQEYRLAGALSGEPVILDAYLRGADMHIATAALKFKKDFHDITKDERKFGKTMNFAIIYGTTIWGLKRNFKISLEESQDLLDEYWAGYPRLFALKTKIESKIMELGYSITPMGRKRYFKPIPSFGTPYEIEKITSQMKREGFNMVIQGGGADVTKLSIINMENNNPFGNKFSLLLQVHDEVVAEVEDSILKEAEDFMRYEMVTAFQPLLGKIPAITDAKISKRWTKES